MIQKIETMVKGIGEMSLDAIYTWFPKVDRDEIKEEIDRSQNLELQGNVVLYLKSEPKTKKKTVKIVEKEIELTSKSNVITEEKQVFNELTEGNKGIITAKELSSIIAKYNLAMETELENLTQMSYENKAKAIKDYYNERFTLEVNDTIKGDDCEFITLKHKQKGVEVAYLLIANRVRKNIIEKIYKNHSFDTVYFCQLDDENSTIELPMGEYYYKNCNELISTYMPKYKLEKKHIEIYNIVKL